MYGSTTAPKPEEIPLVTTERGKQGNSRGTTREDASTGTITSSVPAGSSGAKPTASSKSSKKERDMVWDNAKLILTVFVTTGHTIANYKIYSCFYPDIKPDCLHMDTAIAFYTWFHMFEMPGFVFISGYFSRSFVTAKGEKGDFVTTTPRLKTNLTKIFFVWLMYTLFSTVFNAHDIVHMRYWRKHGRPTWDNFSWTPFCDLGAFFGILFQEGIKHGRITLWEDFGRIPMVWYLFSLFLWRLSVPYFKIFKRPLLVAFATAYIAAFIDWEIEMVARTFGYLPFFALGLFVSKDFVDLLKDHRVQYACTAYLFGMYFVVLLNTSFFYNYVAKVPSNFRGWSDHWQCIFYYFWTVSMSFSFFAFVSMTLSSFKGLATNAQNTLYNYLLHYPILMAVSWFWDWELFLGAQTPVAQCGYSLLIALCIGVITTTQITIPVINHKLHLFQWLISPNVHWLFDGSEEVTLENCMGDSSGVCTGHFGLGYCWSAMYRAVKAIFFTDQHVYESIPASTIATI
uniref:Acyltransferase 3 domain-containing protein n=1 Tax=Pyramimonas obovata TaxID=1411642 RepID=A0A7S0RSV2_9CHLO|mmetsp:Transcript_5702/g.11629  ORF Transcript_5702/g.11629 Transcript_5702/m.11629 type:complete len:513 (+) Transcript_5702:468-2006(+)|eukprot:CAMPEP_0118921632 /NCGR_PEP_ID=MMETSP1169-20130426/843_1 /TAXON_ID=36882 /ORGANISM="Pyramimonas obovata, Strain CCMP722" /LENGTH=512 /DNA_ID=CAMNT_0006862389 /DNA_START=383 /DNA_END=1921 /DNA_ORIENTATION=-